MALPLLLGLGLGYLGGAQYLLKKTDERKAQSLFDQFQSGAQPIPGLMGQQQTAAYESMAQQLMEQDTGFLSANKADQMRSLLDQYRQDFADQVTAEQEAEKLNYDRSVSLSDQLDQDYNRDLRTFASVVQPAYQQAVAALSNNNSADTVAALYNFFNILEPGGRVTENEDGSFTGIGGSGQRLANWLNQARGGGLSNTTREQILKAINNQYSPQLERARRQRAFYNQRMSKLTNQGYNIQSPVGSLGADYDSELVTSFGSKPELPLPEGYSLAPRR